MTDLSKAELDLLRALVAGRSMPLGDKVYRTMLERMRGLGYVRLVSGIEWEVTDTGIAAAA